MNIFIHSIIIGKTFPLDLQPSDTIENVKARSKTMKESLLHISEFTLPQ